jgi:hypothetical protein
MFIAIVNRYIRYIIAVIFIGAETGEPHHQTCNIIGDRDNHGGTPLCRVRVMRFNISFNNILAISWRSVLLAQETAIPTKNRRPAAKH